MRPSLRLVALSLVTLSVAASAEARGPTAPVWALVRTDGEQAAIYMASPSPKFRDAAQRAAFGWVAKLSPVVWKTAEDSEAVQSAALAKACEKARPRALRVGAKVNVLGAQGSESRTLGACQVVVIGGDTVEVRLALSGAATSGPTLALVGGGAPQGARLVPNPAGPASPELVTKLEAFVQASRGEVGKLPTTRLSLVGQVRYQPPSAAGRYGIAQVCMDEQPSEGRDDHDSPWCDGVVLIAVDEAGAPLGVLFPEFSDPGTRMTQLPKWVDMINYGMAPIAEFTFGPSWGVLVQLDAPGDQVVELYRFEPDGIVTEKLYSFCVE